MMHVGMRQGRFLIAVGENDLQDSLTDLEIFERCYRVFLSYSPWRPGYTAADNRKPICVGGLCLNDGVEWVLLSLLKELGLPRSRGEMTVKEFWNLPWNSFRVTADAGGLKVQGDGYYPRALDFLDWTELYFPAYRYFNGYVQSFPKTSWSSVSIPAEPEGYVKADQHPRVVHSGGGWFHLQPVEGVDERETAAPITRYAKMTARQHSHNWSPEGESFSLSQMHSVVTSDSNRVLGILIPYVPNLITLRDALQNTAAEQKITWKRTLKQALETMHQVPIFWNCAHLDCIMVDSISGRLHIRQCGGRLPDPLTNRRLLMIEKKDIDRDALSLLFNEPQWN